GEEDLGTPDHLGAGDSEYITEPELEGRRMMLAAERWTEIACEGEVGTRAASIDGVARGRAVPHRAPGDEQAHAGGNAHVGQPNLLAQRLALDGALGCDRARDGRTSPRRVAARGHRRPDDRDVDEADSEDADDREARPIDDDRGDE